MTPPVKPADVLVLDDEESTADRIDLALKPTFEDRPISIHQVAHSLAALDYMSEYGTLPPLITVDLEGVGVPKELLANWPTKAGEYLAARGMGRHPNYNQLLRPPQDGVDFLYFLNQVRGDQDLYAIVFTTHPGGILKPKSAGPFVQPKDASKLINLAGEDTDCIQGAIVEKETFAGNPGELSNIGSLRSWAQHFLRK